ncbi:hypothetical protein JMJ77_0005007, partial [Colletotrichum scovillei]
MTPATVRRVNCEQKPLEVARRRGPRSRASRLLPSRLLKGHTLARACPNPSGFRRLVGSTHDTRPLVRRNKMHNSRFNRCRNQNRCPCTGGRPITSHSTPGNISIRPAGFGNSRDWGVVTPVQFLHTLYIDTKTRSRSVSTSRLRAMNGLDEWE